MSTDIWEYYICSLTDDLLYPELNRLGQQGWELVTRNIINVGIVLHSCIFKRKIT